MAAAHFCLLIFHLVVILCSGSIDTVTTVDGNAQWGIMADSYAPVTMHFPGDQLLFQWNGFHDVVLLDNLNDFDTCSPNGNLVAGFDTPSNVTSPGFAHSFLWTPVSTGTFYFKCGVPGHCQLGMKVAVLVVGQAVDCSVGGHPLVNGTVLCFNETQKVCDNGQWVAVGSCVHSGGPGACVAMSQSLQNGSLFCFNGIQKVCNDGEWVPVGSPCVNSGNPCNFNNVTYLPNDFLCDENHNVQCWDGNFISIGTCNPPELINCTYFGVVCAVSWSSSMSRTVVYCGLDGNLASAASLCYFDDGEYYCDNNRLGLHQNWLMRSANSVHQGFHCPLN